MIKSHSLIFSDFDTKWYKRWARELKQDKNHLESHQLRANKFWQNAVIAQALYERNCLKKGSKGIGFGVGRERLPALFAKHNVLVTASDQDFRTEKAKHWQEHELAYGAHSLNRLGICAPKQFEKNVSYEAVNMKNIPEKFHTSFDFVWSNCALGHLGSIQAGLDFIINSAKCLKPNGVAVHTTEINVLSDSGTVDNHSETVIFRPKDIYRLSKILEKEGFTLDILRLNFGSSNQDNAISMLPKFGNDFSKLQVGGHLITQVVLILERKKSKKILLSTAKHFAAHKRNRLEQRAYAKHPFLVQIRKLEKAKLNQQCIAPLRTRYAIKLGKKPKYLYLEFKNNTSHPLFSAYGRLHTTKPLVVGTAAPQDRKCKFIADDWLNNQPNRPSPYTYHKPAGSRSWQDLDYIKPHSIFAFRLKLSSNKVKPGIYEERFLVLQEGATSFPQTEVTVSITVS